MSAPKFTGGWKVVNGHYPCFRDLVGPSFKVCAVMQATDLTFADAIQREDELRLMSAAPELYEALEAAEAQLVHDWHKIDNEWGPSGETPDCDETIAKVRAALAKARGESNG